MKNLLRQTNDPQIEAGLQETRPFYWFLLLVLVILYALSLYASPELRRPALFLPYTTLFFIHIALHWYMPYLAGRNRKLALYLLVQIGLASLLIYISKQPGLVIGLYTTLAGETIGMLEDWRQSLAAIVGYLVLIGVTYTMIWGWEAAPDWLFTALIALLFVLFYVLLFVRQLNARAESQRLLAELQEAHAQLAEYAGQVETLTRDAERERMARELHDTLAQGLAGLVLQLEALEAALERDNAPQALQIAAQAKDRARSALAGARRAIDDLRAVDAAAAETIAREVERFTTATAVPCALQMPLQLNLSPRGAEHAARCVSEGLANVARHAQATQAAVTIREEDGFLQIQIWDNGRGFDAGAAVPAGHYGLLGLRERARLAGGSFHVQSEPGAGTTLTMTLPLHENNGEEA